MGWLLGPVPQWEFLLTAGLLLATVLFHTHTARHRGP